MKFLDKIGLGQKRKELSPIIGERKKKEQERLGIRHNIYVRSLIFLAFIAVSVFSLPANTINTGYSYTTGQPWRSGDLTAPFDFAINKTDEEIEQEKQEIKESVAPIFHVDQNAAISIQSSLDSLYREFQPVLDAFYNWQEAKREELATVNDDSIRFIQEMNRSTFNLTESSMTSLLESYDRVKNQDLSSNQFIGMNVKQRLEEVIDQLLEQGIINQRKGTITHNKITIRDTRQSTERSVNLTRVRDLKEANEFAQVQFNRFFEEANARLAMELYNKVIKPNYIFSPESTQERIEESISNISETKGAIASGQVIIRRGDIVTPEKANILESLAEARSLNASKAEQWIRFGGQVIVIIMISFVFFMYIYLYRRSITYDNSMFLLVFLNMGLISFIAGLVNYLDVSDPYIVPVAIAPIVLTIIFDSRVGLVASITLATLLGLINSNNFEYVLSTFAACSLGVFSVRDIKDRSQFFFTTPGVVLVTYVVVLGSFSIASLTGWEKFSNDLLYVAISSAFILFTYPLILLFEKLFGVTTDFTLIELGNTNQPLLQDLMNKAPGTFHHSLQVANLSEAAATAIGANALLCRVGALYHDIGKMVKPEYFVENQSKGINEHDKLKPQMSAMVIKAHVSEGVKMAQEADLPKVIINFIETHHGTSVIRYFYEKAREDESLKEMLQEDQFRYEGPLPSTLETGILLLADGIEAASRAMKNPTYSKLENLVNRMIDDRVAEGQLSHCPLTFRHLQVIKETFLNILVGVYHSRVEYPEEKKEAQAEAQKSAAEANTTPSPDVIEEPQDNTE